MLCCLSPLLPYQGSLPPGPAGLQPVYTMPSSTPFPEAISPRTSNWRNARSGSPLHLYNTIRRSPITWGPSFPYKPLPTLVDKMIQVDSLHIVDNLQLEREGSCHISLYKTDRSVFQVVAPRPLYMFWRHPCKCSVCLAWRQRTEHGEGSHWGNEMMPYLLYRQFFNPDPKVSIWKPASRYDATKDVGTQTVLTDRLIVLYSGGLGLETHAEN